MKAILARIAVTLIAFSCIAVSTAGMLLRRLIRTKRPWAGRIVLIGSFHNAGWLNAHVLPLSMAKSVSEIFVVCDSPLESVSSKIRFCCPTDQTKRLFGRQFARLITLTRIATSVRPDIYIGYHIMPNAPLALLMSGLFGGRAIYQMTGGPIQIRGGGHLSENPMLRATRKPSKIQELILFSLVRQFHTVVVRGKKAEAFIRKHKLSKLTLVLTGAIDTQRFSSSESDKKQFDVVCVSRLVDAKGINEFLAVVAALKKSIPDVKACLVGDGYLMQSIADAISNLNLQPNLHLAGKLENVLPILKISRTFVLTSPNEGMSIAMLEAMSTGLPVIVRDVGELSDAVIPLEAGVVIREFTPEVMAKEIATLLQDEESYARKSAGARLAAVSEYSVEAVAAKWSGYLDILQQSRI